MKIITKRNLSIVALVFQLLSAFMLFINGTFIWHCTNMSRTISKSSYSFSWMIDMQLGKGLIVWLLLGMIIVNIIVSVITIFKENEFLNQKQMVVLPIIILVLYVILCFWGNSYSMTFEYNGEIRHASAGLGILFYVELVFFSGNVIIEFAKQFLDMPYCKENSTTEELKKYKELFDSGVITRDEFDVKKKQLLGL